MPGLTKVLQIGEDFPQLNVAPGSQVPHSMQQTSQVFVYEDETEGETTHGTRDLIAALP